MSAYHAYCGLYSIYGNQDSTSYVFPGLTITVKESADEEKQELCQKFVKEVEATLRLRSDRKHQMQKSGENINQHIT